MSIASVPSGGRGGTVADGASAFGGGGLAAPFVASAKIADMPAAAAALYIASSTSSIDGKRQEGCFSRHFITSASTSRGKSMFLDTERIGAGGSFICLKITSIGSRATNGGRPVKAW